MRPGDFAIRDELEIRGTGERGLFLLRPPQRAARRERRFTEKDAFLLLQHGVLGLGAAALPRSTWPALCSVTSARRWFMRRRGELAPFRDKLQDVLGCDDPVAGAALYRALHRRLDERSVTYLRERFSRQPAVMDLAGGEHLEASLRLGRGVMLWNTPTLGATIVTKQTMSSAGYPFHQLSVHSHGFSQSHFAVRHLNPAQIRLEDRFLAGRIRFEGRDTVHATRAVMDRLRQNGIVLSENSLFAGRSFVAVPAGRRFYLPFPTTPLSIAVRKGVPLHIVTTIEVEPFARYVTHIHPAFVPGESTAAGREDAAIVALAAQARDIVLAHARANPDQVRIWDNLFDPIECQPAVTASIADHPTA